MRSLITLRRSKRITTLVIVCTLLLFSNYLKVGQGFVNGAKIYLNHIYRWTKLENDHARTDYNLRIIVMVFDRAKSMRRLLESLNEADYGQDVVSLDVWIDRDKNGNYDMKTENTARNFSFHHGTYNVHVHKNHVGLYGQWLTTYNASHSNGSEIVVFFEDDNTVSTYFYKYLKIVHAKYDAKPEINGYSLNGVETKFLPGTSGVISGPPNEPVMKYPVLGSWGFSPNLPHWKRFLEWFNKVHKNSSFHPYVPNHQATNWYKDHERQGKTEHMWTMWHIYYAWANNEYTIYSNFPGHQGLATNWAEKGLHYGGKDGVKSNPLLQKWILNYSILPDNPVTLDIAGKVVNSIVVQGNP